MDCTITGGMKINLPLKGARGGGGAHAKIKAVKVQHTNIN